MSAPSISSSSARVRVSVSRGREWAVAELGVAIRDAGEDYGDREGALVQEVSIEEFPEASAAGTAEHVGDVAGRGQERGLLIQLNPQTLQKPVSVSSTDCRGRALIPLRFAASEAIGTRMCQSVQGPAKNALSVSPTGSRAWARRRASRMSAAAWPAPRFRRYPAACASACVSPPAPARSC